MSLNYESLKAWEFAPIEHSYDERDTIMYALGVGLGSDPLDPKQLQFVYENGLQTLPTMAVILGYPGLFLREPTLGVDWKRIVHGEQGLEVHRPLEPCGRVASTNRVESVADQGPGKNALIYLKRETRDAATGELIATQTSTTVCRGQGGFGGPSGPARQTRDQRPSRLPDATMTLPTLPQAALIYRLSGDRNPLHIDPAIATAAGFDRPILHGLCTYGIAGHALLRCLCDYDPRRLKRLDVRFTAPVWPGETIQTLIWHLGTGRAAFQCRVAERDSVVIDHGYCEYDAEGMPVG